MNFFIIRIRQIDAGRERRLGWVVGVGDLSKIFLT